MFICSWHSEFLCKTRQAPTPRSRRSEPLPRHCTSPEAFETVVNEANLISFALELTLIAVPSLLSSLPSRQVFSEAVTSQSSRGVSWIYASVVLVSPTSADDVVTVAGKPAARTKEFLSESGAFCAIRFEALSATTRGLHS